MAVRTGWMKWWLRLLLLALALLAGAYGWVHHALDTRQVTLDLSIEPGTSAKGIAQAVVEAGAQTSPTLGWGRKAIAAVRTWLRTHVQGFRQMALSDDVSFEQIRGLHGLSPDEVKALMRTHLAPGSYRAWRRRVRRFSDQRAVYK